jgi:molecular chaperone DnaK
MVKDAEAHAAEDKKRKELIEARNNADSLIHSTEKSVAEAGDKVAASDKTAIETSSADLKEALKGEDKEAIESKTQALMQLAMKLGEQLYKQKEAEAQAGGPGGGSAGPGAGAGGTGAPKDGVVDADFEEVDENRKNKA